MNKNTFLLFFLFIFNFTYSYSQESLKSTEEEYYDFLSLQGIVERPTLGYRTLSDSVWQFTNSEDGQQSNENIWKNNNLGSWFTLWEPENAADNTFARGLKQGLFAKVYGPVWFNSYNTAAPYGQNDGALWQGKGYNTALTAGLRLEGYGFEVTFKPQVSFSENREFEYIKPNYSGTNYSGKAETYGYYGVPSIDAPQRFGNKAFWTFDWGDSEVRWTWNTITLGFGTETIWIGSAQLNPIIHSNNAASYPKLDIGLRKTQMIMPHFGWDLGEIEGRVWWGKLSESEWFDNDETNNNSLITGLSVYYKMPFVKDFTVGMNRTMLSKWNNISPYSTLFFIPGISSLTSGGDDDSDQRFSLTFDYLNKEVGWEMYFEWARNDFSPSFDTILQYPFHTQAWTFGTRKIINLPKNLQGEIIIEISNLESSGDYDKKYSYTTTFYAHHKILQGYSNKGQILGSGFGTGGNSQFLGLMLYFQKGNVLLFAQRNNPDLDYYKHVDKLGRASLNYASTNLDFGFSSIYYIYSNLSFYGKFIFEDQINPVTYIEYDSQHRYNPIIQLEIKYLL
ncbi:MAG: hypothetical protein J5710_12925 [Treponema sp.]|nr:hypothetical protein [Treponema sp.]